MALAFQKGLLEDWSWVGTGGEWVRRFFRTLHSRQPRFSRRRAQLGPEGRPFRRLLQRPEEGWARGRERRSLPSVLLLRKQRAHEMVPSLLGPAG